MSVRVLTYDDVARLLPMDECIEAMDEILRALARGELHQPLRTMTRPADHQGLIGGLGPQGAPRGAHDDARRKTATCGDSQSGENVKMNH